MLVYIAIQPSLAGEAGFRGGMTWSTGHKLLFAHTIDTGLFLVGLDVIFETSPINLGGTSLAKILE